MGEEDKKGKRYFNQVPDIFNKEKSDGGSGTTIVKDRFAIPQNQGASISTPLAAKAREGKANVEASKLYSGSVATEGMMLKGKARRDRQLMKDQFKDFKRRGIEDHPEAIKSQFAGTGETGRLDVKNLKLQDKLNRKAQQIQQKREGDKLSFKEKQKLRKNILIQQETGGYGSFKPEGGFEESTKKVVKPEDWKTSRYGWIPGESEEASNTLKPMKPKPASTISPSKPPSAQLDPVSGPAIPRPGGNIKIESTQPSAQLNQVLGKIDNRPGGNIKVDAPSPSPVLTKVNQKPLQTDTSGSVTDSSKNNTSADKIKTIAGTHGEAYRDTKIDSNISNKQAEIKKDREKHHSTTDVLGQSVAPSYELGANDPRYENVAPPGVSQHTSVDNTGRKTISYKGVNTNTGKAVDESARYAMEGDIKQNKYKPSEYTMETWRDRSVHYRLK